MEPQKSSYRGCRELQNVMHPVQITIQDSLCAAARQLKMVTPVIHQSIRKRGQNDG